jgi:hypothetical protein
MPKYRIDYKYEAVHYGCAVVEADDEESAKEKIVWENYRDPEESVEPSIFEFGDTEELG